MRYLFICLMCLLAACAATPDNPEPTPVTAKQNALPPQNLAIGECGYFAWTVEAAPRLFLFLTETRALMAGETGPISLTPRDNEFPANVYSRPSGADVQIEFGAGEETEQGTQYPQARIRTQDSEGWEKLIPLAAVKTCQG